MNLVKLIQEQLSGGTLDKLSTVLGSDPDTTSAAASAAVPSLLSGLSSLASSADGVKKLSNLLSGFDTSSANNFAGLLGGDSGSLISKGTGLLSSLLGDGVTASAASAISKFAGLNAGIVKNLMALLMPLILGKLAGQWRSQGGTANALTSLFTDQKKNIADALPAGFSLANIPGLGAATDAAREAAHTTRRAAEATAKRAPSIASWLVPMLIVFGGGLLLWNFLRPKQEAQPIAKNNAPASQEQKVTAMRPTLPDTPAIPGVAQLQEELSTTFKTLGETFAGIKDAASAEAAAPKLEELSAKIDNLKKMISQAPEAARSTLNAVAEKGLAPLKEQTQRTLNLPGLSDRIKALINQIVRKLEDWKIINRTG